MQSVQRFVPGRKTDVTDAAWLCQLAEAGLSYDEVKRLVKIPSLWGAKISGEQFEERAVLKK